MESDFQVRVATGEFTSADGKVYGRGTLLIGKGESGLDDQAFFNTLAEIAKESTVDIDYWLHWWTKRGLSKYGDT